MSNHVVVGSGPIGTAIARHLVTEGHDVALLSRSGRGPDLPGVRRGTVDAADAGALTAAATGADVLHLSVNPPNYALWAQQWPPLTDAFLTAAEATGAVLAITGNLYPYGPVDGPMREGLPDRAPGAKATLRAHLTAEAMARHAAGRLRAVEVRASDFVGANADSHLDRVLPRALAGKPVRMIGRVDLPHSFTWVGDVARAQVAAASSEATLGRVWHVPTNPPRTQREAVQDHCRAAGIDPVPVRAVPHLALRVAGLFQKQLAELEETRYQFTRPYVLDSSASEAALGLRPTPWAEICRVNAARFTG
ncbi:MAG TPA: NAD-dependent epimerase/dehydratase family protein [Mycobacteriales bacterium]|nr:NAD-dependent epimerase/dehydratase family protein [Mycobacteriales bacterium]